MNPGVDPNVARLRWLLTMAAREVGLVLSVNMINKVCDAEDALMRADGIYIEYRSNLDSKIAEMERS